ncbi:MAG: type IV pilin protein [Burkholderiaceae bacterium]|jgi:type IV pilus assembly protein PilE|nr:type IV pilin protein [Burkholderiaceae bacterium]
MRPLRRCVPAKKTAGFTLIEVMIAVAVVAILATVAYPSYVDYVRKGKRATAQAALMEIAGKQQSYLLDRRSYAPTLSDLGFAAPGEIASDYTFSIPGFDAAATPPAFVAQAEPSAALKARGELTLTVNQSGAKTPAATTGYWGK